MVSQARLVAQVAAVAEGEHKVVALFLGVVAGLAPQEAELTVALE